MIDISSTISQALSNAQNQKQPKIQNLSAEDAQLREQTDAFEALLLKTLLDTSMKMDNGLFPKAPGHDIYMSMYREHMSEALAGSFGYSDALFNWVKEEQNIAENGGMYVPDHLKEKKEKEKAQNEDEAKNR